MVRQMENPEAPATAVEAACEEKATLTRRYVAASGDYTRSVQVLHQCTGVMTKAEYEELRRSSENAKRTAEQAHAALNRHIAEHGC